MHPPAWVSSIVLGKVPPQMGQTPNLLPARDVTCGDTPRDPTPVSLRCPGGTAGDLRRFGMGLDALRAPTADAARIGVWPEATPSVGAWHGWAFEIPRDS